jgi:hypothetical protein
LVGLLPWSNGGRGHHPEGWTMFEGTDFEHLIGTIGFLLLVAYCVFEWAKARRGG